MRRYFYSIDSYTKEETYNIYGILEMSNEIKNNDDFKKTIECILEDVEKLNNIKIRTNYKILAFNKI